jgi:hypothetical protein
MDHKRQFVNGLSELAGQFCRSYHDETVFATKPYESKSSTYHEYKVSPTKEYRPLNIDRIRTEPEVTLQSTLTLTND